MSNFRPIDRDTGFLLPPSVDEWLPEKHLARFVVEVIEGLDLRSMSGSYRGSGSASYHPALLLGLLVYGYATGVFSSRKLERASYDSVAFRFIAANEHPDHDTGVSVTLHLSQRPTVPLLKPHRDSKPHLDSLPRVDPESSMRRICEADDSALGGLATIGCLGTSGYPGSESISLFQSQVFT